MWHELTRSTAAWLHGCLFDPFCIVVGCRFQAPPQAVLPDGLIRAASPDTAGSVYLFTFVNGCDGVLLKSRSSV